MGTNHENDEEGHNGYTFYRWKVKTRNLRGDTILVEKYRSCHPMPELRLVEADGGASRWVLEDARPIVTPDNARVYNYVSLSNADKRHLYYVDRTGRDSVREVADSSTALAMDAADTTSAYVLKSPDGMRVEFGRGNGRKWLDVGTRSFHTYWAQVTSLKHFGGDS